MPRALTSSIFGFATVATVTLLSACDAGKSGTETARAVTTNPSGAKHGAVPITSGSEDARKLYLDGRALSEQLRAHDGRQLYQQAAAQQETASGNGSADETVEDAEYEVIDEDAPKAS